MLAQERVSKNMTRDAATKFIFSSFGKGAGNREFLTTANEVYKIPELRDFITDVCLMGIVNFWEYQEKKTKDKLQKNSPTENFIIYYRICMERLNLVIETTIFEAGVAKRFILDESIREAFINFCYIWLVSFIGFEKHESPYENVGTCLINLVRREGYSIV